MAYYSGTKKIICENSYGYKLEFGYSFPFYLDSYSGIHSYDGNVATIKSAFGVGVSYCADEDMSFYSERFGMRLAHTRAEYDLYKRLGEKQKAAEKAKEVYKMIKDFDKAIGSIKSQRRGKN